MRCRPQSKGHVALCVGPIISILPLRALSAQSRGALALLVPPPPPLEAGVSAAASLDDKGAAKLLLCGPRSAVRTARALLGEWEHATRRSADGSHGHPADEAEEADASASPGRGPADAEA